MKTEKDAGWVRVTPDLTAITTPFGLLDRETQEALKAHGGPYEAFTADGTWGAWSAPVIYPWYEHMAFRVKPAPPKPREWWIKPNHGEGWSWMTEKEPEQPHRFVHVIEVVK